MDSIQANGGPQPPPEIQCGLAHKTKYSLQRLFCFELPSTPGGFLLVVFYPGIEGITKTVTQQVYRQRREEDEEPWCQHQPGRISKIT